MTKPLAKSLHTVTVLSRVARLLIATDQSGRMTKVDAIAQALKVLGLDAMPDTYGLAAQSEAKV